MAGRRAILIGIDGYAFQPLSSAVNDALAMRDELLGKRPGGRAPVFEEDEITLLVEPTAGVPAPAGAQSAKRDEISKALRAHYDATDPLDFLLVFFAGHGLMVSADGRTRESLILPSDVGSASDGRNMLSLTQLLDVFSERGPRQQLFIVDACRDMPYQQRPRGFELEWEAQPPQGLRAQVAIFAVAPGGQALSQSGGHGRLTGHLLDGLAGTGSAVDYVAGRGHCITAPSLHDYAKRRVADGLKDFDDWTRSVQTPQIFQNGGTLDPLRDVPPPPPRPFHVKVVPAAASPAVELALEVQHGIPTPGWPPRALPRVYELRAKLRAGAAQEGWGQPIPALRAVDVREQDEVTIEVPRGSPEAVTGPPATTGERGIAPLETVYLEPSPPAVHGFATTRSVSSSPAAASATLRVRSVDGSALVRLRRAQAPWDDRIERPGAAISLPPGVWDVQVGFGDYTSSATRIVLNAGDVRELEATAQLTPTTSALLPPTTPGSLTAVMPSESIGPMQGAILPTLLPLLALKLFDQRGNILRQFGHLQLPQLSPASYQPSPYAVALAVEGKSRGADFQVLGGEDVWRERSSRMALFVGSRREAGGTLRLEVDGRRLDIAAPRLPGAITVVTATSWPSGRVDCSVCLFRLPVGESWPGGSPFPAGRVTRALALAAPLFRDGVALESVPDEVLDSLARAKWVDPVLGALAYYAHDYRRAAQGQAGLSAERRAHLQQEIASNMSRHFSALTDSRILAALQQPPEPRRAAFADLLNDATLEQPVLTASLAQLAKAALEQGRDEHFSVERLSRVTPGEVFNTYRVS